MNGNVGGAVVPSFGGKTTTGWRSLYSFSKDPNDYSFDGFNNNSKVESVDFDAFWSASPEGNDGGGASSSFGTNNTGTDHVALLLKSLSSILNEPIKQILKDIGANLTQSVGGTYLIGQGFGVITTIITEMFSSVVQGKEVDFKKIFAKAGGKGTQGALFSLPFVLVTGISSGFDKNKTKTGLDKFFLDLLWNEKSAMKDAWETLLNNGALSVDEMILESIGLSPSTNLFKYFKDFRSCMSESMRKAFWDARRDTFKMAWIQRLGIDSGSWQTAFTTSLGQLAGQIGIVAGADYLGSLAGNFFTALYQGKSLSEALSIDNMHYGQEALKSVNKAVFATAGKIIGGVLGCSKAGEVIGSLVGGIVNNWICEPFRDKDGNIDEGWCAIAAGAELGGAIIGGAIATAIICASGGPVGWVALGILAGAAICYGIVVGLHALIELVDWKAVGEAIVEAFDDVVQFVDDTIEAVVETVEKIDDAYDELDTGAKVALAVLCPVTILFWVF